MGTLDLENEITSLQVAHKSVMHCKDILIVEDDHTTASIIRLYLEKLGFNVPDIATTACDAIEKAESIKPDLVLMDIQLGGALDGIDSADVIIRQLRIPVVYVTSYSDNDTLEKAMTTECSGYITKPVRESDLRATINIALKKNRTFMPKKKKAEKSMGSILKDAYNLTPAEIKIVTQLLECSDLKHVARMLDITSLTVKTHLKRIYPKLKVNSQSALLLKIMKGPVALMMKQTNE